MIEINFDKKIKEYEISYGSYLMFKEGDQINPGDIISKLPKSGGKNKDITG